VNYKHVNYVDMDENPHRTKPNKPKTLHKEPNRNRTFIFP